MIVLACALLALGTIAYVFMPVAIATHESKSRLQYLYERRDVIYDNLRDLNFEYKAGKYPEADFESMRRGLEDEAARVLAEIDGLQSSAVPKAISS